MSISLLQLLFVIAAIPFLIVHIVSYLLTKFGAFVNFVTIKSLSYPTKWRYLMAIILDGSSINYINYHFVIGRLHDAFSFCYTIANSCNGTYIIGGSSKSGLTKIERSIITTLVPVVSNKKRYLVELNGTSEDITVSLQVNHTASKSFRSCSIY